MVGTNGPSKSGKPEYYVPKCLLAALVVNLVAFMAYGFFRYAPIQMSEFRLIILANIGLAVAVGLAIGPSSWARGAVDHMALARESIAWAGIAICTIALIALAVLYLPDGGRNLPSGTTPLTVGSATQPISWTQLASNDKQLVAKAIVPYGKECPRIDVRTNAPLTKRQIGYSGPRPDFKVTVCEYVYDGNEEAAF